jgi:mRNA interferase RelE/StbE
MTYQIQITELALAQLGQISDARVQRKLLERIEGLQFDPEQQGKALTNELAGHRSIRAVGQRYRIIYQVKRDLIVVNVVAVGLRNEGSRSDIYAMLERAVQSANAKTQASKSAKK